MLPSFLTQPYGHLVSRIDKDHSDGSHAPHRLRPQTLRSLCTLSHAPCLLQPCTHQLHDRILPARYARDVPLAPGHIHPEGPMDAVISAPNQLLHADEHSLFIRCIARSGPQATHTPTRRQILPVIGSVSSGRPRRTHSELRSARAASPPYRPRSQRSGACGFTPIEPIVPRAPQLAPKPCPSPSPACPGGSHICEAPF
jgi:hypothetical protein